MEKSKVAMLLMFFLLSENLSIETNKMQQVIDILLGKAIHEETNQQIHYLHGIGQLAEHLGISVPTAIKLKNSGKLDKAIKKVGRQYNFDIAEVDRAITEQ